MYDVCNDVHRTCNNPRQHKLLKILYELIIFVLHTDSFII